MIEKGFLTKATEDELSAWLKELLKDVKYSGLIIAGVKVAVGLLDNTFADKVADEELKEKCRTLLDVIFVQKDYEAAIPLAVELLPMLYELIKKKDKVEE